MIHILNRREVLITYDQKEVDRCRELLLANSIDCRVKIVNATMGAGRNRVSFLRRQEQQIVYVHKQDWEYAMHLLRKR